MSNKKDQRIEKMWKRGITDPKVIARKLGYTGEAITNGIERVLEGLKRLGLHHEKVL